MTDSAAPAWLHTAFAPLHTLCGDRLAVTRRGSFVRWSYQGHAAIVELRDEGIAARFVDRPALDIVSQRPAQAVYRPGARRYPLDRAGCERMVADMVAFFSGTREPRFVFDSMI